MPLSEEEQRILAEIEEGLAGEGSGLGRQVTGEAAGEGDLRKLRWAIPLALAGIGLVVAALWTGLILLGLAGFLVAVYGVLAAVRSASAVPKIAQESIEAIAEARALRKTSSDRESGGPIDGA